jgi:hypothetical protein
MSFAQKTGEVSAIFIEPCRFYSSKCKKIWAKSLIFHLLAWEKCSSKSGLAN